MTNPNEFLSPFKHLADVRTKRGRFAYEGVGAVVEQGTAFFRSFDNLITYPLAMPTTDELHLSGTRLFLYEWAVGTIATGDWGSAIGAQPDWRLNDEARFLADGNAVWYYDLWHPDLRARRVEHLLDLLRSTRFDGLFLDCLGSFDRPDVPPEHLGMLREYESRHSGAYGDALGAFLDDLAAAGIPLFTNQGYRNPDAYLRHSALDLSESLTTRIVDENGNPTDDTQFNCWRDTQMPWKGAKESFDTIVRDTAARGVAHCHLAYSRPVSGGPDYAAVGYALAASAIYGHEAYVQCFDERIPAALRDPALNYDPRYFIDLRSSTEAAVEMGGHAYRQFEHGLAIVTNAHEDAIHLPPGEWLDPIGGARWSFLPPSPRPGGHVFLRR